MSPFDVFFYTQNCTIAFSTTLCRTPGLLTVAHVTYNVMGWILKSGRIFGTSSVAFALGMLMVVLICGSTLFVSIDQRD
jgi:hypothetical protein